jgi:hypothetical protein
VTVLVTQVTDVPVTLMITVTDVSVATVVTKIGNVSTVTVTASFIKVTDRPKNELTSRSVHAVAVRAFRNVQYYPSTYASLVQAVFFVQIFKRNLFALLIFPMRPACPVRLTDLHLSPCSYLPYIMPVV